MDDGLSYVTATGVRPACREAGKLGRKRHPRTHWLPAMVLAATWFGADAGSAATAPEPPKSEASDYLIGPGDTLQVFVWKNPDLSTEVPVRPDGRITTPLVPDIQAQGRRPTELAADLRKALSEYVQEPVVTVVVKSFAAPGNSAAIRVIGAAVTPKSVPYREGLTVLDALIDVGGLTSFAKGNGAKLMRIEKDGYKSYPLRLKDLVRSGDPRANVKLMPGDIINIPEGLF
jgi:polysaccharide export outer membrane protein